MPGSQPWLGLVLMRNASLHDHKAVGPALVLASSRFGAEGFDELLDVAEKMEALRHSSDRQAARAIEAIYEDEDYRRFRRRALPACVGAPEHIQLFDETMRGNDLLELPGAYKRLPHPFTVLFANTGNPAWSGVIPGAMLPLVIEVLLRDRFKTPPPPSGRLQIRSRYFSPRSVASPALTPATPRHGPARSLPCGHRACGQVH